MNLEQRCPDCDGTGVVPNPAYTARGDGGDENEEIECGNCEGTGYVPSGEGRELLAFVLRHLRQDIHEIAAGEARARIAVAQARGRQ